MDSLLGGPRFGHIRNWWWIWIIGEVHLSPQSTGFCFRTIQSARYLTFQWGRRKGTCSGVAKQQYIFIIHFTGVFEYSVALQLYSAWPFSDFLLMFETVSGGSCCYSVLQMRNRCRDVMLLKSRSARFQSLCFFKKKLFWNNYRFTWVYK